MKVMPGAAELCDLLDGANIPRRAALTFRLHLLNIYLKMAALTAFEPAGSGGVLDGANNPRRVASLCHESLLSIILSLKVAALTAFQPAGSLAVQPAGRRAANRPGYRPPRAIFVSETRRLAAPMITAAYLTNSTGTCSTAGA